MGVDRSGGRYIAVEGPIGVGKTALARRLATELGVPLILEQGEDNPFLRRFYEDRGKYAFQAQLFFLLERYRQQRELARHGTCSGGAVADYLFAKDRICAASANATVTSSAASTRTTSPGSRRHFATSSTATRKPRFSWSIARTSTSSSTAATSPT